MSNNNKFVSRFKDVNLYQKAFSTTSVKAIKEIYAEKFGILKHNVKFLDFSKCKAELRKLKEKESEPQIFLSANDNMIRE
tara:strand:- start:1634 stop:1873 length:240 start_codon:yes stop_codon:yes gene_type:complete